MRLSVNPVAPEISRRLFLRTSGLLAGSPAFLAGVLRAQPAARKLPLITYVGTFSSPLPDILPTQVDLPLGNGRGIPMFEVDGATGEMKPGGVYELPTSPSCLALNAAGRRLYSANETDRVGENKEGSVSAFAIDQTNGQLTLLNSVHSGGA